MAPPHPARSNLRIRPQPDDSTCGPTCLHAVYRHAGDRISLRRVISEVRPLDTGGTLAVYLALHALSRGYRATISTYNLNLFDPSWFDPDTGAAEAGQLAARMQAQARAKPDRRLRVATKAYLEFLESGGEVRFEILTGRLIRRHLRTGRPILTGLSATYLYGCSREAGGEILDYDSERGEPMGHFVVVHDIDRRGRVHVADPYHDNPRFRSHHYTVGMERLIGAILLGVITYDANLLVLAREGDERGRNGRRRRRKR